MATPGFPEEIDFSHQIVPLLRQHCGKCHAEPEAQGGFSINTRQLLVAGGETGPALVPGNHASSLLFQRVSATDMSVRMPPEGEPLTKTEQNLLAQWIDTGAAWEAGFTFASRGYEPPLLPRKPELPPATDDRNHPIDRLLDADIQSRGVALPLAIDDHLFIRRASLDLIGLLPTPEELDIFLQDQNPDKRSRLIRSLLDRDLDYAEHWLTFWNDLLRNDYTGTGFITGGRKQITGWLYEALLTNKPYDQFARELIAPPSEASVGFIEGIRWRGEVSAGQTVEIQFAQSVGQSFLGINLKCASCHDSFIDRWTLEDAYGLAAIYSQIPLEIHRCDKTLGKKAEARWLFPELGTVDPSAPQAERLQQLAALMTHRENGRFTRTIVNRLWHRLMGHGIVHPTDAMQSEPWNADLLDYLAEDLVENGYDLKKTMELIATSRAYQSKPQRITPSPEDASYVYGGPRSKRMTAEQFIDALWQLTDAAPRTFDAPLKRGLPPGAADKTIPPLAARWIWNRAGASDVDPGETIAFRQTWEINKIPSVTTAVITCDNEFRMYVNGRESAAGAVWDSPVTVQLTGLVQGKNEILIVARNGGNRPNPAALFFAAQGKTDGAAGDEIIAELYSDSAWQWTRQIPDSSGSYGDAPPTDWQPAVSVDTPQIWDSSLGTRLQEMVCLSTFNPMVRASLVKSDFLMRSLGRPNRDQIVSVRPEELTTLEAIDLSNGETIADLLRQGGVEIARRQWESASELANWIYIFALARPPTSEELQTISAHLGEEITPEKIEDLFWAVIMLPEFQIIR